MAFRWLLIASLGMLVVCRPEAGAQEYVVATTGDDGAAGTKDGPLKTIGKAVALAGPGDTILVHGRTYTEGLRFTQSGRKDQPIKSRD